MRVLSFIDPAITSKHEGGLFYLEQVRRYGFILSCDLDHRKKYHKNHQWYNQNGNFSIPMEETINGKDGQLPYVMVYQR